MSHYIDYILCAWSNGQLLDTWWYRDPQEAQHNIDKMAAQYAHVRNLKITMLQY